MEAKESNLPMSSAFSVLTFALLVLEVDAAALLLSGSCCGGEVEDEEGEACVLKSSGGEFCRISQFAS